MRSLPYLVPDKSKYLNAAVLLLVVQILGKSQKGKILLNNERLLIFMYLIKNPVVMTRLLARKGMPSLALSEEESYSVASLAVNLDPLFDNGWIKSLLQHIASIGFLDASYRKTDGFVYTLTEEGAIAADKLTGEYFKKVREYLQALDSIKTESTSSLNAMLNEVFKQ